MESKDAAAKRRSSIFRRKGASGPGAPGSGGPSTPIAVPSPGGAHRRSSSQGDAGDGGSIASIESAASSVNNSSGDAGSLRQLARARMQGLKSSVEGMMDRLRRDSAHGLDFLATLKRSAAQDTGAEMRKFIERFESDGRIASPHHQSQQVQGFYQDMKERMEISQIWRDVPQEQCDGVLDGLERYLMQHLYDTVFAKDEEDEKKDLLLQTRMRQLHWVTPEHLEARIKLSLPEVAAELENAQEELITMDAKRAPQDKLACVVACSKSVFLILQKSATGELTASADDFLPALIYVLIKANPPLLHSNIEFVNRFCNPARLMAGEAGYYFTNLMGAAAFIQNLNAEQLKMDPEKFERLMQGDNSEYTEGLDSIRIMKEGLERLRRLENKQKVLQQDVQLLTDTITALCASAVRPVPVVPEEALNPTEFTQREADGRVSPIANVLRRSVSTPATP